MPQHINKLIELDKPLVIFDLETTGLAVSVDRIIEIAYLKVMPNCVIFKDDIFLNPEMEVPQEAIAIHGITNKFLEDKPTFKEKAQEIWEIFNTCHYGGYNILNFDLLLLRREFIRAGIDFDYSQSKIIDAKAIFHYMEPRTLSAAYKFYLDKELIDSHSALADVEATAEIIGRQLKKYHQVRHWDFIYKIQHPAGDRYVDNERKFYWRYGQAHFAFSKYKDQSLKSIAQIDPGFLQWILTADFSEETKIIVRDALDGKFPQKIIGKTGGPDIDQNR